VLQLGDKPAIRFLATPLSIINRRRLAGRSRPA